MGSLNSFFPALHGGVPAPPCLPVKLQPHQSSILSYQRLDLNAFHTASSPSQSIIHSTNTPTLMCPRRVPGRFWRWDREANVPPQGAATMLTNNELLLVSPTCARHCAKLFTRIHSLTPGGGTMVTPTLQMMELRHRTDKSPIIVQRNGRGRSLTWAPGLQSPRFLPGPDPATMTLT